MIKIELSKQQIEFTIEIIRSKIQTYKTMQRHDGKGNQEYTNEIDKKLKEFENLLEVYKSKK